MNKTIQKFIAFEWLMMVIIGLFWAAAMFLPLFLTGSFVDKQDFGKNVAIMAGPYCFYLVCRLIFLFIKSLKWAYLVADVLYTSEKERNFAKEWLIMSILVVFWFFIMAFPLYIAEMFTGTEWPKAIGVIIAPYIFYTCARIFWFSLGWAISHAQK